MRVASFIVGAGMAMAAAGKGEGPKKTFEKKPMAEASSSDPLLTASGVVNFVTKSVYLTKDLTYFGGSALFNLAFEYMPPNIQSQVIDHYEDATNAANTFRVKNGIPAPAQLYSDLQAEYSKKVSPHLEKAWGTISAATSKVSNSEVLKSLVDKFEKEYPQHAGSISTELFDLLVLLTVVVFFVMRYAMQTFCYVCCCGFCSKRKSKADAPKLQKVPKTSQSGKKMR